MLVTGVNKLLGWCQVISGARTYTCITKEIDGELHFLFKKKWHKVAEYISEYASELVSERGKIISRAYRE